MNHASMLALLTLKLWLELDPAAASSIQEQLMPHLDCIVSAKYTPYTGIEAALLRAHVYGVLPACMHAPKL